MAYYSHSFFFLFALMITALASAIPPPICESTRLPSNPPTALSLATRLKIEGEPSNCWESLFQLQACSGEVIMFFLNGETYLGSGCCQAIRVVGHDCWPDVMTSLGFTTQEGDVLRGYCDEAIHSPPSPLDPKHVIP